MQDTVLFLGGAFSGLRKLRDPIWATNRGPYIFPIRGEGTIEEERLQLYPHVRVERYSHYSTKAFGYDTTEIMVLAGLDPFVALGQYLRGEYVQ